MSQHKNSSVATLELIYNNVFPCRDIIKTWTQNWKMRVSNIFFFDVVTSSAIHDVNNYDVATLSIHHKIAAARATILGFSKCVILALFLGTKT